MKKVKKLKSAKVQKSRTLLLFYFCTLLLLYIPSPIWGAIALVSSQHDAFASGGASKTAAFDATGANFLVVAITMYDDPSNVSGVTYNGVAMTASAVSDTSTGQHERVYIYTLIAPASGSHNIVASFSPSLSYSCDFITSAWSGAHATTPVVSNNGAFNDTSVPSPFTLTVTIDATNVAIDAIYMNGSAPTQGGSQTLIFGGIDAGGGERIGLSYKPGAASNMSWTNTATRAAIALIEIAPAAGGGGGGAGMVHRRIQ